MVTREIHIIEPLLEKIKISLLGLFEKNRLQKALSLYGTEEDFKSLSEMLKKARDNKKTMTLIDFTPIMSLGTKTRLNKLIEMYQDYPFIAITKKGTVLQHLKDLDSIPVAICEEDYTISNFFLPDETETNLLRYCKSLKGKNFLTLHSEWVNKNLSTIVPKSIRKPPKGQRYVRLPDDTWANVWIDVKSILTNSETSFFIAYQIGYLLTEGYSRDIIEEGFIVGNNIAYILASFLQQIFDDKKIIIIDHMGPYPSLSRTKLLGLNEKLREGKFIIVEDVISTGRELDLLYLLIFLSGSEVERAVSFLNLEVASPVVFDPKKVLTLCNPTLIIRNYKRLLKYGAKRIEK